jgi:two-component system, cell cycle sensor histidine kinase and response regulator CckA
MATPVTGRSGHIAHEDPELRTILLAQKSELLGELAQAMANRFNNVMMAVTSYAELELKKTSGKEKRNLEQLLDNATHATFLIRKLLNFTCSGVASPQAVHLDQELNEIADVLRELLGEQTDLELKLGAESAAIHIDCAELEQILFALAVAARKTTARDGKVTITTSIVDIDREFIRSDPAEAGKYVALVVESCGSAGTLPGNQPDLDPSAVTDLSLVAVRQIVEQRHGLTRLSIKLGVGSSFKLYFPLGHATEADHSVQMPRNPAVARTILVVEDDDAVRIPASEFLMMEGFKVLQARTGKEALHVAQQSRSALDLLVTDIFMPKMNGHEVAAELMAQNPELKVLYISGDPGRSMQPRAEDSAPDTILQKPFRLNTLLDKIHDLLGE